MPIELEVQINDKRVRNLLRQIAERVENLKPAFDVIGETVHASITRNFELGGRPKWKPLSRATKNIRRKKGKWPGQVLIVSGALKRISYKSNSDSVTFSANQKHAALHQFGAKKGAFGTFSVTQQVREHIRNIKGKSQKVRSHKRTRKMSVPWGDIPARPFMMVQKEDWTEIREALSDYILGGKK